MLRPPRAFVPTEEELATAFYREAVRDLQDARVLHTHRCWPGCMTASMHATEKALKAMLLLYGAANWLDLNTHEPYKRIENHPLFHPLIAHFQTASPGLVDSIRAMEDLTPKTQFLKGTLVEGRNPEYPYIDTSTFALECPETVFSQADSEQFYLAARQVVEIVRSLSSGIQALGLRLPRQI